MLVNILIGLAVVIVLILVLAATKPATFHMQRSTTINATGDRIFPLINDYHNWGSWSPWEKIDPGMKRTYTGPSSGVGAGYQWSGNSKAGEGSMQITNSVPSSKVDMKLDFTRPFKSNNMLLFSLNDSERATRVVWQMDGKNTFMGKLMSVFTSMDKLVGKDFEKGLASMKAVAER